MAFTVQDFHDLIELLAQHPEWRTELRWHVLSDELIELPAVVWQLVEAQSQTTAAVRDLAAAQFRTEERLDRLVDHLGEMDGQLLSLDFGRKGPACLGPIARRLRSIESGPLAEMLDDAVDEGRLTADDQRAILQASAVWNGKPPPGDSDVYLCVEVASDIVAGHVQQAMTRAKLLEKLGRPVLPVVVGRRIHEKAASLARALGVWVADEEGAAPPPTPDGQGV